MNDPHAAFALFGQRILVTGASSGIGLATAEWASQLGARVVMVGRDEARLQRAIGSLVGEGHTALVRDIESWEPDADLRSVAEDGRFTGIVHSAGILDTTPVRYTKTEAIHRTLRVNLASALVLARAFRQKTVRADRASMVFVSSVMGLTGEAARVAYSAAKGGLIASSRSLAIELAREGIRVNCVAPGVVAGTAMSEKYLESVPEEGRNALVAAHPLGLGRAEDVAAAICFLLAPAARWVTGTTLVCDGGYTAR